MTRPKRTPQMVYFFRYCPDGPIKIGCAVNYAKRLSDCQTYCPYPLHAIAIIKGSYRDEARYHRQFKDSRLCGEWFSPTPDLLAFIAALPEPDMTTTHAVARRNKLSDPATKAIWLDKSIEMDGEAATMIGLSVDVLRIWLGPSGRAQIGPTLAKSLGTRGGLKKGVTAAKARNDLIPTERVREILDRPGMTYERASELLGGKPFSPSTLRRHFPKPKEAA